MLYSILLSSHWKDNGVYTPFDWIKNAYSHTRTYICIQPHRSRVSSIIFDFPISQQTRTRIHRMKFDFFGFCFKISINFKVAHECVQWMGNRVYSIFSRRFCVIFLFSCTVLFSNFMIYKMSVGVSRTEIKFYTVHLKLDCGLIENDANRIAEC